MILHTLSDVIVDCLIAAIAAYLIYRAVRHIRGVFDDHTPIPAPDPVDAAIWDVLAEARRITEEAGGNHGVTG